MKTLSALALLLSLSSIGCYDATGDPGVAPPVQNQVIDEPSAADIDTDPGSVIAHKSGLIKLAAVQALPTGDATLVPVRGYPGSSFHLGAFTDQDAFDAFASVAGKVAQLGDIDWSTQIVVYAVLDAQTNDLDFAGWMVTDEGDATLSFDWITIEPYYPDATPAVLAVVTRSNVKSIRYLPNGTQTLGSYRLP